MIVVASAAVTTAAAVAVVLGAADLVAMPLLMLLKLHNTLH